MTMENAEESPEALLSDRSSKGTDGIKEGNIEGDGTVGNDEHTLFIGQSFNSCNEAFSAYKLYAKMHGYSVRIQRTVYKRGPGRELNRMDYVCHRAGAPGKKSPIDVVNGKRNTKSCRCLCKAHMTLALVRTDGVLSWHVKDFSDTHNHELLNQNEVRLLRANRVISQHCKNRLLALEQSKVSVREMLTILAQEQNVPVGRLPFNAKDVHNFFRVVKHPDKKQDASNLLVRCAQLKEKDPNFQFVYEVDEHNRVKPVAWSHATHANLVPPAPISGDVTQCKEKTENVQALALKLIREAEKSALHNTIVMEALTKCLVEVRSKDAETCGRCTGRGQCETGGLPANFVSTSDGREQPVQIEIPPSSAPKGKRKFKRLKSVLDGRKTGRRCKLQGYRSFGHGHDKRNCPLLKPVDLSKDDMHSNMLEEVEGVGEDDDSKMESSDLHESGTTLADDIDCE